MYFENANGEREVRECDRVIFACNRQSSVLGLDWGVYDGAHDFRNIEYFDDVSVTHSDQALR